MENLLKEKGNSFDLDMDVLLKKSMNSVVEDGNLSKKENKAKKISQKEQKDESPEVTDSDSQEDTSRQEPIYKVDENEASAAITTDTTTGDHEDSYVKVVSEEPIDVSGDECDECGEYKAQFFEDRPLTDKFIVVRVNDDLAQKIRVMLWRYPDLSTSAYVNNILQHHFREFRTVLETMAREVSESVIEVMS